MKLVIVLWFESRLKDYIQVYGKYERNERNLRSKIMKSKKVNTEIDTLEFEIDNQELNGTSGSGWWYTAFKMTLAGRCGLCFTCSYECTTNNVHC